MNSHLAMVNPPSHLSEFIFLTLPHTTTLQFFEHTSMSQPQASRSTHLTQIV